MKKKILFVDDEPSVLQGLKRSLRNQRNDWDMHFVDSGKEALKAWHESHFDAIVTDMRMPEMDGSELLGKVVKDQPDIIRIILSGHSDEDMIIRSADTAHQFITKPCDAITLKGTLLRAFELSNFLGEGKLHTFMTGLKHLPSIPDSYRNIREKLRSPDTSLKEIGDLISTDPAMTAKILQLVNSAFFGLGRHVSDAKEAATLIGFDALKALVLSIGIFTQFDQKQIKDSTFHIDDLLNHSLAVARLSERIAQAEGADKTMADDCFLAGMLHNIGLLILEQNLSEGIVKVKSMVKEKDMDWSQAEKEVFGTSHGPIGAYLLGLWALPNPVVEAVAFHNWPSLSSCDHFGPLCVVHVANKLLNQNSVFGNKMSSKKNNIDHEFLTRIGMEDRLEIWKKLLPEVVES